MKILLALLAAAACTASVPGSTDNGQSSQNRLISAACQQAQDDCQAMLDAVAAQGSGLATTCQTEIANGCQGGPGSGCTQAQTDCANAVDQVEQAAANAIASCNADVSMNCDGSGSGSSLGSGSNGLSGACEAAVTDCLQQTQSVLQGGSLPDCGSTLLSACMDPTNLAGCQSAITACANDAQDLQSNAGSAAAQCSQEITSACE